LLFGSRARGDEHGESDYDLNIVSPTFAAIPRVERSLGLRELWRDVGGEGAMDLICLTPEEFEAARHRISLVAAVLPEAIDLG
jgi:predicted nucleotidyltransferase